MEKPVCRVLNLRASALSGFVSEIDAIATGGHYLSPDASGCLDASRAHDLCVSCVNCGSVVSKPGPETQLTCSDCGMGEFHVVQTFTPPPRRPTYTPLNPTQSQAVPPSRTSDDDAGDDPNVSPWARWAARSLDFYLGMLLAAMVIGFFLGIVGCDTDNMSEVGWLVLSIPFGLVLDAFVYHLSGWTLGKWLFAVKVRHLDGSRLLFADYLKRNFWVFVRGMGLVIPIVSLVAQVIQYNRMRAGKTASYDEGKDLKIVRVRHDVARTVCGIVALVILFVFFAACS